MTASTTRAALQQHKCRECEQLLRQHTPHRQKAGLSRILPVQSVRSESRQISNRSLRQHAANATEEPILLKNSVFGEIGEFFARTVRPTIQSEGFGQNGLLPLMWQLTAPHGKSHLTFRYNGLFPKTCDI